MDIKEILNNYNVEGKIYLSDVRKYFGWDLPIDKVYQLREVLEGMKCQK